MSAHFIEAVTVLWAVLAICSIGAFAYLTHKVSDLECLAVDMLDKLTDMVGKARGTQQAQMNELLETRIEVRNQQKSLMSMFELFAEIEPTLMKLEGWLDPEKAGEIELPELTAEYEEIFHKEMVDDKDLVCRKLAEFLRYTRAGEDIESIEYEKVDEADGFSYEEYAVIKFKNGFRKGITITGDSGKAIAADVIKAL